MYLLQQGLTKDDKRMNCPWCDYFEVWHKDNKSALFYCKNKDWWKWTCLVHNQSFNYPKDPDKLTKKEKQEKKGEGPSAHFKWEKYKEYVDTIIDIWVKQSQRLCPNWGYGGRKDDNWNHITCKKCGWDFWYVWGIFLDKNSKSNHFNTFFK